MNGNQKLNNVLNQVLSLEVSKGHLKWKVSDLARMTGMSRPLIYYHLGNTKRAILENSMDLLAQEFYGLGGKRAGTGEMSHRNLVDALIEAQAFLAEVPLLVVFYSKCRAGNSPLHKKFVEIEKRFQQKLARQFQNFNKIQIIALYSIIHGVVTSPFVSVESIREAVKLISAKP